MERKMMAQLHNWYCENEKRLLIVTGAGGVGKTWLMKRFLSERSLKSLYIDMREKSYAKEIDLKNPDLPYIFIDSVSDEEHLKVIEKMLLKLKNDNTLGNYRLVIAGTIVSESVYKNVVGDIFKDKEITYLRLYPLSFDEFAKSLPAGYRRDRYSMLKIYMIVGGMPECINSFIADGDLTRVREKQREIMNKLQLGIGTSDKCMLRKCCDVIRALPLQCCGGTGFKLRTINPNAREREYGQAIKLLEEYGIIYRLKRFEGGQVESINYKLQLFDIGLYGALSNMDERNIYYEEELFNEIAVINLVVQELVSAGISRYWRICYWNGHRIKAKLPIVLAKENGLVPIELMARENGQSRSMNSFLEKFQTTDVIRILNPLIKIVGSDEQQKSDKDIVANLYQLDDMYSFLI